MPHGEATVASRTGDIRQYAADRPGAEERQPAQGVADRSGDDNVGIFKTALLAAFGVAAADGRCFAATVWEHYPPLMNPGVSGIVVGDFDGDGRADAVVTGTTLRSDRRGNLLGWFAADSAGRLSLRTLSLLPPATPSGQDRVLVGTLKLMPREGEADRVIGIVSNSDWSGLSNEIAVFGGVPLRMLHAFPAPGIEDVVTVADVDADGSLEIVALASSFEGGFSAYSPVILDYATGAQEWRGTGSVVDAAVAQMDGDPALELIFAGTPGRILDGATRNVEWSWPSGFGTEILVGRFAADPSIPTFATRNSNSSNVQTFRGQPYTPIGELQSTSSLHGVFAVPYAGADRLAFVSWSGAIAIRDAVAGTTLYSDESLQAYGINALSVADIDGDARPEMIYGTPSTPWYGMLRIVDLTTQADDYKAMEEIGPHAAIARGDLSGDGSDEVVFASYASGNRGGHGLFVVDADTGEHLRARPSDADVSVTAPPRLSIAQLDADAPMEIVVSGSTGHRMFVAALDGVTLLDQWRRNDFDSSGAISAQAMVDANGDGTPDVVIGSGDGRITVLDGRNGVTLWQSVTISGDTPWSIETLASPPRIVASRGNGVYAFDASSGLVVAVAKTPASIDAMSRWGEGASCRIGALDTASSLRIHACADLAFLNAWSPPAGTSFFRALDAAGDHLVTVNGDVLYDVRRGGSPTAQSGPLGHLAASGNLGVVVPLGNDAYDVIVGSMAMVTRIRLGFDAIFSAGFE